MHVAVTGAAGMIGRKLVARLVEDGRLGDAELERLTLVDVVAPDPPPRGRPRGDLPTPPPPSVWCDGRPDVIVHLAAVVSGEAEADFDKGYRVNLDGTRALLDAVRARRTGTAPVWSSPRRSRSTARRCPNPIPEDFPAAAAHQLRHPEGDRRAAAGRLHPARLRRRHRDPAAHHLHPPGPPNKAASGFFSSILREPLVGQEAVLPVPETVRHWHASPRSAVGFLRPSGRARSRTSARADTVHARPQRHRRRADRGAAPGGAASGPSG